MITNYLRFAGIFFFWIFFALGAPAQWNTDLNRNLLISEEGKSGQDLVSLGETSDGGVYVSWVSWENDSYYLKVQLLDKDGRCRFAPGGIYVCKQPTPTWSSGYGYVVTGDDRLVIASTDLRNGEWQAYVYKISPEGVQEWEPEGVPVMKTGDGAALNPKVIETQSGNFIVGYQTMDSGLGRLSFLKLASDGTASWGAKLDIVGASGLFNMVPSGSDGFIVTYFEGNSYYAQKYSATGDEAWEKRAEIDPTESVKPTSDPYVVSDGEGGLVTGWRYAASAFTTGGRVQHVDADGNCSFEEPFETGNLPFVAVDRKAGQILVFSSNPLDSKQFDPRMWKVDFQGNNQWSSDGVALSEEGLSYAVYGISVCSNGDVVCVYRNGSAYNEATIEYTRVGSDGTVLEQNEPVSTAPGDKGRGGLSSVRNGQVITVWGDNNSNTGGMIFAQNTIVENLSGIGMQATTGPEVTAFVSGCGHLIVRIVSDMDAEASVRLYGTGGTCMAGWNPVKLSAGTNIVEYPLNDLSKGVYLLSVGTTNTIKYKKVVVK